MDVHQSCDIFFAWLRTVMQRQVQFDEMKKKDHIHHLAKMVSNMYFVFN